MPSPASSSKIATGAGLNATSLVMPSTSSCGCSAYPSTTPCARSQITSESLTMTTRSSGSKTPKISPYDRSQVNLSKNGKIGRVRRQCGHAGAFYPKRFFTMPARPKTPQPNTALLKCSDPPRAYDQSVVIRSKFTIGAWTLGQLPCDANLVESTLRKKSVTSNWNEGSKVTNRTSMPPC